MGIFKLVGGVGGMIVFLLGGLLFKFGPAVPLALVGTFNFIFFVVVLVYALLGKLSRVIKIDENLALMNS